jgi:hypothetical protein
VHGARGRALVLFFYPKDFTPGCTREVCSFRDAFGELSGEGGARVVGVSRDDVESHKAFIAKPIARRARRLKPYRFYPSRGRTSVVGTLVSSLFWWVGRRRDAAHSAVADGPRAGLRPLKWEPGAERPVCTGLPGGAPVAGATVGRSPTAAVQLPATLGGLSCCSA